MKNRVSIVSQRNTTYFKNGVIEVGRDAGSAITQTLRVAWQTTNGNKKNPNPFRYWKVDAVGLSGRCTQTNPSSGFAYATGGFPSAFDTDGQAFGSSEWMYTQAYNEAVARLGDQYRGGLDLSVDLFQARKTAQTINSLIHGIDTFRKSIQSASRGGKDAAKEIGSKWLMWIYGIKPTMQSAYELVQKINSEAKSGTALVHIRARGKCIENKTEKFTTTGFGYQKGNGSASIHNSVRCQLDIYLKPDVSKIQTLAGYTSLNPASIAWELMPLSFVVDWAYNIGGFLRSAENALLYARNFHSGTITYSQSKESECITSSISAGSLVWTGLSGFHVYRVHERQVMSSYPVPRRPVWAPNLGTTRLLNAAALLSQFLGSSRGSRKS